MTRRRHRPPSPPAALEVDDLLRKIFLLLPPQPSLPCPASPPSASSGVASSPTPGSSAASATTTGDLRSSASSWDPMGTPSSGPISALLISSRMSHPDILNRYMELFGCRHGRVLFFDRRMLEIVVCDPATGYRRCVAVPPRFDDKEIVIFNGAVLCTASGEGHVHGDCHSSPFQVILIGVHTGDNRAFPLIYSSVYSSETRTWGDLISTLGVHYTNMYDFSGMDSPATLVGDSLYWLFDGYEDGMLKFDLDRQSLVCMDMPDLRYYHCSCSLQVMPTDDSTSSISTIGVCMVQPESMQFKNLGKDNFTTTAYHPYKSFYTAVSDLAVCEKTGGISTPLAKDDTCMTAASWGVGTLGGNDAASSSGTLQEGAMFGNSKHIDQGMDADLVPTRVLMQTRIDVIFKKEMETRSKLSKAWAKWFRSNGVPGNKADCPHFRNALKLTQQLGTRFVVPTGGEIDGANLDASDEELP